MYIDIIKTFLISIVSPTVVFAIIYKIFNFGKLYKQFEDLVSAMAEMKVDVAHLKDNMSAVRTFLVTKHGMQDSLFTSHSPLKLEKKGLEILDLSGFKTLYANNKMQFLDKIKEFKYDTPADIDNSSILALYDLANDSLLAPLKNISFEKGLAFDTVLRVCSIYLRQQAIKELLNN